MYPIDKKIGFVSEYERGQPIRSYSFDIFTKESGKYIADISTLFLPLQPYEEEKALEEKIKRKYITHRGGDICLSLIDDSLLILVIDLMGHGPVSGDVANHLVNYAAERGELSNLVEIISNESDYSAIIGDYTLKQKMMGTLDKMRRAGYSERLVETHSNLLPPYLINPTRTACQCVVNLDEKIVAFQNVGHPEQYCLAIDDVGTILDAKSFPTSMPPLGILPYQKVPIDVFRIPEEADQIEIFMYSDAILDQILEIGPYARDFLKGLSVSLRERHEELLEGEDVRLMVERKLVTDTIRYMANCSPLRIVEFFFQLIIEKNNAGQKDDVTLVAATIRKSGVS